MPKRKEKEMEIKMEMKTSKILWMILKMMQI